MDWIEIVRWVYHLRIPLITLGLLAFLPLLLARTSLKSLGANIVSELSRREIFAVGGFAALTAMPIVVGANALIDTGYVRFNLSPPGPPASEVGGFVAVLARWLTVVGSANFNEKPASATFIFAAAIAAAVLCTLSVFAISKRRDVFGLAAGVAGLFAGAVLNAVALAVFAVMIPGDPRPVDETLTGFWAGYRNIDGSMHDAHAAAAVLFAATAAVFVLISLSKWGCLAKPLKPIGLERPWVPTFGYLLTLVSLCGWIIGGASYAIDFLDWPGPTVTIVLLLIFGATFKVDHYYRMRKLEESRHMPRAGDILLRDAKVGEPHRVILVGAAGGGIQAAAWTAQVLAGVEIWMLDNLGDKGVETARRFRRSIRMVSGVSGGSVGLYHYIDKWPQTPAEEEKEPRKKALQTAIEGARAPSLDAIGWGLAGPDFFRVLGLFRSWGGLRFIDRGWALDQAIASWSDWTKKHPEEEREQELSDWLPDPKNSDSRPAVVFNSTLADSGRQMLFSTTCFNPQGGVQFLSGTDSADCDDHAVRYTLPAATAARLSATFPYVSPAARGALDDEAVFGEHCVDGGYYDNYGVRSIAHWLEEGFAQRAESGDTASLEVLILELIGLPRPNVQADPPRRGWPYQIGVPVVTMYGVALGSQDIRNVDYLRQFEGHWERATPGLEIQYRPVIYEPPHKDETIPLNWRLIEENIRDIEQDWKRQAEYWGPILTAYLDGGAPALRAEQKEREAAHALVSTEP